MKFSIIKVDKKKMTHLTVKPAEWFMEHIQADTKSNDVGRLREHIALFGDTGAFERKVPIPVVCPSVELAKAANGNLEVVAFNGLVTLHVADLLRTEDIEAVKEAARMLPMTFAAFTGADGRSVEILVSVTPKSGWVVTEQEMDRFCQVAYEAALGVYTGILPKPVERQMVTSRNSFRMTVDASPYLNLQSVPLQCAIDRSAIRVSSDPEGVFVQRETDMDLYAVYERMYERAVSESRDETDDVVESQRHEAYVTELASRLCAMGMPEEEAFLHLHNHHRFKSTYDEETFRSIVAAVYAEDGHRQKSDEETVGLAVRRLIRFLTTRYVFRYNTVMGYTEYRPNNTWVQDWQPCDETVINGMTIEARLAGLDVRDKDVRRYVRSNMIRQSDPIDDFLAKVSDKWDGKTDHIALLARCVPCDLPQWEQWFRKWFLSMVAQWLLPQQEYGNAIVPLLISAQGDGKTTFCRMILPRELRWGFQENLDVCDKRQTLQAMHNFLLINLDEFNQISPRLQQGFLKNVIQLPNVKIKRPYGKHVEEFKRYASFIATTNESSVLCDPTGNRRFICVQLTAPVHTDYKPNYEALYGQACTLIMQHREQWWFSPQEVKAVIEHNRQFELVPPAVQYFNEYYEVVYDEAEGQWQSPTAIFERLRHLVGGGLQATSVAAFGRYLKSMPGLVSRRVGNSRQYLVREKE